MKLKYEKLITALIVVGGLSAGGVQAATYSFTSAADWDTGSYANTNNNPPPNTGDGHVRLSDAIGAQFNFLWVALSGRDGIARIDTDFDPSGYGNGDNVVTLAEMAGSTTGPVKGEYLTRPNGRSGNPSRTTVDLNGDVWVGNRNESSGGGSVTKVKLETTGTTSSGAWNGSTFGRLDWTNAGGVDNNGGVSTAADSAIEYYVRTPGTAVRTIAVDANNDVWTGGFNNKLHARIDGSTGVVDATTTTTINPGGYGGLVDGNGILWTSGWSSAQIGRYDTTTQTFLGHVASGGSSYGLGIDSNGNIFNSHLNNNLTKLDSNGNILWTKTVGVHGSGRGVAVTAIDDNVWMANSGGSILTRTDNDGNVIAQIGVGSNPTGVSVDSNGKVWVTNLGSDSVMRIDPTTNLVDLTIELGSNANPYNYSDMTGSIISGITNPTGTWTRLVDSLVGSTNWDQILWNQQAEGTIPLGASLTVEARAANSQAGLVGQAWTAYNMSDVLGLTGRYLELRATFKKDSATNLTPVLSDIRITTREGGGSVPEPSLLALLGIGVISLAGFRRRKRV